MADTVRFIHTADLHLDSPLRSLAARNPALGDLLRDASRRLLQRLIDTALEEQVDALLIAGDLFDGEQEDIHTAMVLQRELRRLQAQDIPVFIIWGNHDAETRFLESKVLDLPDNVHAFDGRGGKQYFANDRAVVHGVSFTRRKTPESLLGKYGKADPHCFNIGMLHTSLTGAEGHNDYAPCTVNELIDKGFDYWALGHIHKRQIHHEQPAIVMPGNPLGRHINEAGERSISLVTLASDSKPDIRRINLAPVRFERLPVSLDSIDESKVAYERMLDALNRCRESMETDILIVRLELEGHSVLASSYQRDRQTLLVALQTEFEHRDDLWIDSISAQSLQLPEAHDDGRESNHSIAAELQTLVGNELLDSIALQEAVADDLRLMTKALPADLNTMFGRTPEEQREFIRRSLLPDGAVWMQRQLESLAAVDKDADEATQP
ncbi:metallophosphoesterase family protein [Granulosicoccus sp. 3-233]|uniref:metallophosphoesterase family protein n=1 Tax=Granulosicoccus sp. 3-233 TaxID=3417969 RepID=UPI003D350706